MRQAHRVIVVIFTILLINTVFLIGIQTIGTLFVAGEGMNPVKIDNNTQLSQMASMYNWPGDGSATNPYMIENYTIDARGYNYGIYVGNTTLHFMIRNCTISGTRPSSSPYFPGGG